MATLYKITTDTLTFEDISSIDTVIELLKNNNVEMSTASIIKYETSDVTSLVTNMLINSESMQELREKNRVEHNLVEFNSAYMINDKELPYDFDLSYDIKCEGELADKFRRDGYFSDELYELCLSYGYTTEYLVSLDLNEDIY